MVFVVDHNKKPLSPCHPARARKLLAAGKAAVLRRYPFTLVLRRSVPDAQPALLRLKLDPGSRTTGITLLDEQKQRVVWAAELHHRGAQIRDQLAHRRALRRNRRSRKTRYRTARFLNRTRPSGWLAPSLQHRVDTTSTWVRRLQRFAPVGALSMELARFDTQLLDNPDLSGVAYQQGTLAGYEVREYLLETWRRECAYCGANDVPLQVEHVISKRRGGSNRVSNLTLSCQPCNQAKGIRDVREFLAHDPKRLARVLHQLKAPLRDAAAVNATRWALYQTLAGTGVPLEVGTGGCTKYNRTRLGIAKSHWADAACVGVSTPDVLDTTRVGPLKITAVGHGSRRMVRPNRYGFPASAPKGPSRVLGFRTGDQGRLVQPRGTYAGTHTGSVVVRTSGLFDLKTWRGDKRQSITAPAARFTALHRADGYRYAA